MEDLPRGTVTFLFTDIEGSTRLWETDAPAMWRALGRHDELLKEAIQAQCGVAFKSVGDAVQAAFFSAPEAVCAAVEAQRLLAAENWPVGQIRVRMAIHCGEAEPAGGDYTAPCLNRLARLLGTGYGGQVLLTDVVRSLVEHCLPEGVSLLDLGAHRLRDLLEPERVAQLAIAGLPDHFPPLKSLERWQSNFPVQPTELIGRDTELRALKDLVKRSDVRLVTLTGPGGIGKTRLALQVGAELLDAFEHGAFFVDLAPIADPALVLPAIAQVIGVRETGGQTLLDALIAYLASRRVLLLLDNFEQVAAAAPVVAEVLGGSRQLSVIATSRAPLRIRGEHEWAVQPLALPHHQVSPSIEDLAANPAVQLFVQRAQAVKGDFQLTISNAAAIASICIALDGLPLAIELAAARIRLFSPAAILARLERRLGLLTGGARDLPKRQQTLRDAIAWSYELMPVDEQRLFAECSVFTGGWTLEAAEAICGAQPQDAETDEPAQGDRFSPDPDRVISGLSLLTEQSLLQHQEDAAGNPRFTMLATIREFAQERLAALGDSEADRFQMRHAQAYLALAESVEPQLIGDDQAFWLDRIEAEHDNLRAALSWFERRGDAAYVLRGVAALWRFWWIRGHLTEGRTWLNRALKPEQPTQQNPGDRAKALSGAGMLAQVQGDYAQARRFHEDALALYRDASMDDGIASTLSRLGLIATDQGDYEQAERYFEESLALDRKLGIDRVICADLSNLGMVAFLNEDYERAAERYENALQIGRHAGDRQLLATVLVNMAEAREYQHDLSSATELYQEALSHYRALGDRQHTAFALAGLGRIARNQGDLAQAATQLSESLSLSWEIGDRVAVAAATESLAAIAVSKGAHRHAARLAGAASALRREVGAQMAPAYREDYDRQLDAVRSSLSDSEFIAAYAEGEGLPLDQAVALAMTGS